jgi:hypothetical protein
VGLFLAKDLGQRTSEDDARLDMSALAASLGDIVPEGAEQPFPPGASGDLSPQFLLLSGAYPEPGWGVHVFAPKQQALGLH